MKQKHENITLSFPVELTALLHVKVPARGLSKYVADVVRKALDEDEKRMQSELEKAYEMANLDADREAVIKEWESLDQESDKEWVWEDD